MSERGRAGAGENLVVCKVGAGQGESGAGGAEAGAA